MNSKGIQYVCINCENTLKSLEEEWLWHCQSCGLDVSLLDNEKYNGKDVIGWTESASLFLKELRENNACKLLDLLSQYTDLKGKKLLDIGCAAGWFLSVAEKYQLIAIGIEPDTGIAQKGLDKGLDIKTAIFPDESIIDSKFDIVTFNDVFEHIKEPFTILSDVHQQLNEDGYLIINLPTSDGFIYRLSRFLSKLCYKPLFHRLWQKGYVSPHLYYYSNTNLKSLVEKCGFKLVAKDHLDILQIKNLYQRINHEGKINRIVSSTLYFSIILVYPLYKYVLPPDIMVHIYRKD